MGAIVRAFDVRPVTKEQVEAMGAQFLLVDYEEDGSGAGGYAKEMSPGWHKAAQELLTRQCSDVDIVITTALIPGKRAPIMITKEMVAGMKNGSVMVDLAAETGGNIETTVPDQKIVTSNGVTCIGYTDLPSRLSTTSSSLYANNISKFLLSIGPQTTKAPGYYFIDHNDEAVRGMLVVENGKLVSADGGCCPFSNQKLMSILLFGFKDVSSTGSSNATTASCKSTNNPRHRCGPQSTLRSWSEAVRVCCGSSSRHGRYSTRCRFL
jgi:hypothetical protein